MGHQASPAMDFAWPVACDRRARPRHIFQRRTEPVTKAKTNPRARAAISPSTINAPADNPEARRRAALRASGRHILPRKPGAPPLPEPEGDEFTYMLARTLARVTHAPRRCREP